MVFIHSANNGLLIKNTSALESQNSWMDGVNDFPTFFDRKILVMAEMSYLQD